MRYAGGDGSDISLRIIDRQTVSRLLTYEAAIPLMREAMIALSTGWTQQTLRQIIHFGADRQIGAAASRRNPVYMADLTETLLTHG